MTVGGGRRGRASAPLWSSEVAGVSRVAAEAGVWTGECEDSERRAETEEGKRMGEGTSLSSGSENRTLFRPAGAAASVMLWVVR